MREEIRDNITQLKKVLPAQVQLVAVSKTKPIEFIREAYHAGQRHFGENKVQEMAEKHERLPSDIQWHMIGHVQTNKIKQMAPFVHLVHGMDKAKRLKELNKEALKNNRVIDCLLQVHIAEETTKFGFLPEELTLEFVQEAQKNSPNLRICGLMGMATFTEYKEQVRKEFMGLKDLFDNLQANLDWPYFNILSMGMSGDYEMAIETGSTMVRVGSKIFGGRS